MADTSTTSLDTDEIKSWRSIVTLIVFVITNVIVLFPFYIPIYVPRPIHNGILSVLRSLRIIPKKDRLARSTESAQAASSRFVRLRFHMVGESTPCWEYFTWVEFTAAPSPEADQ